jgi:hypothetical protein
MSEHQIQDAVAGHLVEQGRLNWRPRSHDVRDTLEHLDSYDFDGPNDHEVQAKRRPVRFSAFPAVSVQKKTAPAVW